MKKLALPLLVATTMSLTACCECVIPDNRYQDGSAIKKGKHHDGHQGRHGHDHHNNQNNHAMNPMTAALPAGALMLADSPLTNSGWDYRHLSVGKGILNFFNGNNISSVNGNLAQHRFAAAEDQENFSQPDFDQAASEYMQQIGAVEFFNASLSEATASELQGMVGFNSGDYTDIDPTNHTLRQYMTNTDDKPILYQVISDANHGEIGVFSIDGEASAIPITATKPEPVTQAEVEPAIETNSAATSDTTAEVAELETVETAEEKPVAKPNVQAQINLAPVVPVIEEVVDDSDDTSEVAKPDAVDEDKQEPQAKPAQTTVYSESMQSQLGDSGAITLNINFDTSKATIRNDDVYIIDELHKLLRQYPDLKFVIQGHTDDVGEVEMNQRLSLARAKEVKAELEKKGIASDRLKAEGYGESKPLVDNTSDENRARNRRVELRQF